MTNTVQLTKNGESIYPVTDISLVMGGISAAPAGPLLPPPESDAFATKTSVDVLSDAVNGISYEETDITSEFTFTANKYVGANPEKTTYGKSSDDTSNAFRASGYVDISQYSGRTMKIAFLKRSNATGQTNLGLCFFSGTSASLVLRGIQFPAASEPLTTEPYELEITIDPTWKLLRTTYVNDEQTYGAFYCKMCKTIDRGTLQEQIDDINEEIQVVETLTPEAPTDAVPEKCLANLTFPDFGAISPSEIVNVSTAEEFTNEWGTGGNKAIILNSDIIIQRTSPRGYDKYIYGNGHKIAGYDYVFAGDSATENSTHNVYPVQGEMTSSLCPMPYFIDSNYKIYQWKSSEWYDTSERVTKADGTDATSGAGDYRVKVPSGFGYTAQELSGAYIQFFAWYVSMVGKITSLSDGYLYFTVSEADSFEMSPDADYEYAETYTSFRVYNLKSPTSIYFDDTYIYVPKSIGSLYHLYTSLYVSNGHKCVIENTTFYGSVDGASHNAYYKLENCEVCYLNLPVFKSGSFAYLWLKNCYIHHSMSYGFNGFGEYNIVENCLFRELGENRCNSAAISLRTASAKNWIIGNRIENFGYCAIYCGTMNSQPTNSSVIENNIIRQTQDYYLAAKYLVPMDSGAIYIATWNDKTSVGAVVRKNIIHSFNGRKSNRGIFCDDGASYFYAYANQVSMIKNSYCIDARYATGRPVPTGYVDNNEKYIINNIVDGAIRCEVGSNSTVDASLVRGNTRLYGNRWGTQDVIRSLDQSALYTFASTILDKTGYFDADGFAHSSAFAD